MLDSENLGKAAKGNNRFDTRHFGTDANRTRLSSRTNDPVEVKQCLEFTVCLFV